MLNIRKNVCFLYYSSNHFLRNLKKMKTVWINETYGRNLKKNWFSGNNYDYRIFHDFFIPGYLIKNFRIKINIKMLNKKQRIFHIKLCSLSTRTVKMSKLRIKNDSVFNVWNKKYICLSLYRKFSYLCGKLKKKNVFRWKILNVSIWREYYPRWKHLKSENKNLIYP